MKDKGEWPARWEDWVTGAQARQNAISLNSAIGSAVSAFNQSRGPGQKRAILVNFSNAYNPTPIEVLIWD